MTIERRQRPASIHHAARHRRRPNHPLRSQVTALLIELAMLVLAGLIVAWVPRPWG